MGDLNHQKKVIELEREIWRHVRKFRSDDLILSVHNIIKGGVSCPKGGNTNSASLSPVGARGRLVARRFSNPHRIMRPTRNAGLGRPTRREYLTADPWGRERSTETGHTQASGGMLQGGGSQSPVTGYHGAVGRRVRGTETRRPRREDTKKCTKAVRKKVQKMTVDRRSGGIWWCCAGGFVCAPQTRGWGRQYGEGQGMLV